MEPIANITATYSLTLEDSPPVVSTDGDPGATPGEGTVGPVRRREQGGCGCATPGSSPGGLLGWLGLVGLSWLGRRRR